MTSWDGQPTIITASGVVFNLIEPRAEDVRIVDIAHGLSMTCRWAGHTSVFYSVAEHSTRVSMRCDRIDALAGLLHDAAEAYLGDVSAPLKRRLPEYQAIEDRLLAVIFERFGLPVGVPASVKQADRDELENDRVTLTQLRTAFPGAAPGVVGKPPACFGWWEARWRFLYRANELGLDVPRDLLPIDDARAS